MPVLLAACGGSTPEPQPAEPAAKAEAPAAPPEESPAPAAGATEPAPARPAAASEEPEKRTRSAKDVLTADGVMFSFSFNDSAAYAEAEKSCDEKAKDDPKKRADCVSRARDRIDGGSLVFRQEGGKWYWLTIQRSGARVTLLNKVEFEFGEESDTSVTLVIKGRDTGKKPRNFPPKVVIQVPDESRIAIDDPKRGKLVYLPKMGAIGEPGR
jgi:hypothetical protein